MKQHAPGLHMRLNLGCGMQVVDGWLNVDYSLGARLTKIPLLGVLVKKLGIFNVNWDSRIYIHNLTRRFPWADGTVTEIYSSHTLEHLSCEQGRAFLAECFRVLSSNGRIRILVPDLRAIVDSYRNGDMKADEFLSRLGVLYSSYQSGLKNSIAPFVQFPHKCMYDESALCRIMKEAGFEPNARAAFESDIGGIETIEIESRTHNAVIVEATKPA